MRPIAESGCITQAVPFKLVQQRSGYFAKNFIVHDLCPGPLAKRVASVVAQPDTANRHAVRGHPFSEVLQLKSSYLLGIAGKDSKNRLISEILMSVSPAGR